MSTQYEKICIIGSNGYLGSAITNQLPGCVTIPKPIQYTTDFCKQFSVIIYLAGISHRTATKEEALININDIKNLADNLNNQLLIYMSTSAIYEGLEEASEKSSIDLSNLEEYSRSMIMRENIISYYKTFHSIGLRLGNVVGIPPITGRSLEKRRKNVYISMLFSAFTSKTIHISYPKSNRAFLSLEDFNRVIECILSSKNITGHHIYNISNYNSTIEEVAHSIALETDCVIKYDDSVDNYLLSRGFSMNSCKFKTDFRFEYLDNASSIIRKLLDKKEELLHYFL